MTINGRALALQGNDWSSVARELVEFSDCANDPIEFAVTPAAPAGLILRAAALVCEHRPRWFSISLKGGPTIAARAAPSRRDGLPKAEKKCAETSVTIGKQSIFVGRAQAHFSAIGSRVYDHEGTRAQGVLAFTDRLAPGSCEELESAPSRVDLQALSATVARMGAGGSDCGAIRFSATDDVSWKDAARVAQHLTASGRSLLLESEIPPGTCGISLLSPRKVDFSILNKRGGLTQGDLDIVLDKQGDRLRACFEDVANEDISQHRLEVEIDSRGKASSVMSPTRSDSVSQCLQSAFDDLTFPEPRDGQSVVFAVEFSRS